VSFIVRFKVAVNVTPLTVAVNDNVAALSPVTATDVTIPVAETEAYALPDVIDQATYSRAVTCLAVPSLNVTSARYWVVADSATVVAPLIAIDTGTTEGM
jgi:hypothetical protein